MTGMGKRKTVPVIIGVKNSYLPEILSPGQEFPYEQARVIYMKTAEFTHAVKIIIEPDF